MNDSLDDLIAEYLHSADLISQMIRHGNELLHRARETGDAQRIHQLKARQQDLYAQREHVLDVATHLKTYYSAVTTRIK